jgi:hypothetical protein
MTNLSIRRHRQPYHGNRSIWTEEMWTLAQIMRADGKSSREIASEIGLKPWQVDHKFRNEFTAQQAAVKRTEEAAAISAAMAQYAAADASRDLTSRLCGDPIPGRSALRP